MDYIDIYPDEQGKFGEFGGIFAPEILMPALQELTEACYKYLPDESFQEEYYQILKDYSGRPTPLYHAARLSEYIGCKVYLKREDLNHGGAHKINNVMGQALLAKKMGKTKLVAETGAGQHGFATAIAGAYFGMETKVFMGEIDIERQAYNVYRMQLLGAKVIPVKSGSKTLKDAVNEGLRYWIANVYDTHYLMGSVVGPHPYPLIVREFQRVIGKETKKTLRPGDIVRARIVAISPPKGSSVGKIGLTSRQPFLGKIAWITEELEKVEAKKNETKESL